LRQLYNTNQTILPKLPSRLLLNKHAIKGLKLLFHDPYSHININQNNI